MKSEQYKTRWRLLPTIVASGSYNMALDQVLLEMAAEGRFKPTLRFYRWYPPALSIGRFQKITDIDLEACGAQGIDVVRRPTGGRSILHLEDFTYSLILPSGFALPDGVVEAYTFICGAILVALDRLGLKATVQSKNNDRYPQMGGACFSASTQADLEFMGRKICGSSQVRRKGAVLQHGSIHLRDHSEILFSLLRFDDKCRKKALDDYRKRCITMGETDIDCSWDDLAASFRKGFGCFFGAAIEEGRLSDREESMRTRYARAYASKQWLINATADNFPTANKARHKQSS
jgi:lipoate-protein ligase A